MAPAFAFGPVYCETLIAQAGVYPAEPINTISNGVIVAFGLAATWLVAQRAPKEHDLYLLCALLVATGVGSGLWHGLREPWALQFDVTPGLFFLFAVVFCWARRLWGWLGAGLFLLAFFFAFQFSRGYWGYVQRWVALAPVVVVAGAVLVSQTWFRSRNIALMGVASVTSAMIALMFRTIDLQTCATIPFGTHFLWHIFLSAAGFIGIVAQMHLPARSPAPRVAQTVTDPAE